MSSPLAEQLNEVILKVVNTEGTEGTKRIEEKIKLKNVNYLEKNMIHYEYTIDDYWSRTKVEANTIRNELDYIFKYSTYVTEFGEYVYVRIWYTVRFSKNILETKLTYKTLPKVTYFETIPEDLLYVISFYTKSDPGFIGSSQNAKNAYKKYLTTLKGGYVNNFDSTKFMVWVLQRWLDIILTPFKNIKTDQINKKFGINSFGTNIDQIYVMEEFFRTPQYDTIFSGKLKNGEYFVFISHQNIIEELIFSTTWKFVWDKLPEEIKNKFYIASGYDKVFELLKY